MLTNLFYMLKQKGWNKISSSTLAESRIVCEIHCRPPPSITQKPSALIRVESQRLLQQDRVEDEDCVGQIVRQRFEGIVPLAETSA